MNITIPTILDQEYLPHSGIDTNIKIKVIIQAMLTLCLLNLVIYIVFIIAAAITEYTPIYSLVALLNISKESAKA
jgi:hypothetical protein